MSIITKIIDRKEFMLHEAKYSHARAKQRARTLRSKSPKIQVRITPYESKWAIWLLLRN